MKKNEIVIIDEGDQTILGDPVGFEKTVKDNLCFALTGTIFDGNEEGIEINTYK